MAPDRKECRRALKEAREKELKRNLVLCGAALVLLAVIVIWRIAAAVSAGRGDKAEEAADPQDALLTEDVVAYRDLVETYAEEEGISAYVPILMAIMEVETKGYGSQDVMQSSASGGHAPGTLGPEASIEQACVYFAELVEIARERGCDLGAVIQAYNFGPDYLRFVAEQGGRHTMELAESFAASRSGGSTVSYDNAIAQDYNGGWRYTYGNMFYEALVRQYLPDGYEPDL